ncbi:MAG: hypothetical protein ACI4UJ_05375 [Candidatus Cryptobacteroides sp.]
MVKIVVKFPETKALQSFDGAIRTLNLHIQLVDSSLTIANNHVNKNPKENVALALHCSTDTHPQLNVPCTKKDIGRIYTTSRKKIHEQAIVELYSIFATYIRNIIEEFIYTDPYPLLRVVGENKDNKIEFKKIISIGNYDSLITHMATMIYRRLENERSTPELLNKIISYTKIEVADELREKALFYLEIRHLIIHNGSKADEKFLDNNNNRLAIPSNHKLPINYKLVSKSIEAVTELCHAIDQELIKKNMVRQREINYTND